MGLAPSPLLAVSPMLVADDQVHLTIREGALWVTSPPTIAGRIEVRGIGLVRVPYVPEAKICLVAELVGSDQIERMPEPLAPFEHDGLRVRRIQLFPFEASAPLKLMLALSGVGEIESDSR